MARIKMVTRTVTTIKANVKVADINANALSDIDVYVPEQANEKALMKLISNECEAKGLTLIKLNTTESIETLYGMPESEFIKYAQELPKRATTEKVEG